jgi:hypothetical protein
LSLAPGYDLLVLLNDGSVIRHIPDLIDLNGDETCASVYNPGCTQELAVAITSIYHNHCILLSNGVVKCWGTDDDNNEYGQLGTGNTEPVYDFTSATPVNLGSGRSAVSITSDQQANCAILDNGEVKCWGGSYWNRDGAQKVNGLLGVPGYDNLGDEPGEMGDNMQAVTTIESRAPCGAGKVCPARKPEQPSLSCSSNRRGGMSLLPIIGGAVGGVALIAAACCCWLRRRRRNLQESHRDVQVRIRTHIR